MIKQQNGFAILAALIVTLFVGVAEANPPPAQFSLSLNERGNMVVLQGGRTELKCETLTMSVSAARLNDATSIQLVFMWPEGTQDAATGEFKNLRRIDCRKQTSGTSTVWTADVEAMRRDILDTAQGLACFYEATMPDGSKRFLSIGSNTFEAGLGFVHVDESLNVAIGSDGPRPDRTFAIGFKPKPAK